MKRIDSILRHESYRYHLHLTERSERERIFCKHNMAHCLDVARIAMLINLKEQLCIEEELIYAAALLHDIGRHLQVTEGVPHEQASSKLASKILKDCGFEEEEIRAITEAIESHRRKEIAVQPNLSGLLYRADKSSRACFACEAETYCDWSKEKKNNNIIQ